MNCPKCDSRTHVYDSRHRAGTVSRRRECLKCGFRFATTEIRTDTWKRLWKGIKESVEN